jgi:hypothetical protein
VARRGAADASAKAARPATASPIVKGAVLPRVETASAMRLEIGPAMWPGGEATAASPTQTGAALPLAEAAAAVAMAALPEVEAAALRGGEATPALPIARAARPGVQPAAAAAASLETATAVVARHEVGAPVLLRGAEAAAGQMAHPASLFLPSAALAAWGPPVPSPGAPTCTRAPCGTGPARKPCRQCRSECLLRSPRGRRRGPQAGPR